MLALVLAMEPANGKRRAVLDYAVASLLMVAPCFWQARIQAGDLSSHVYNAWLAAEARQGRAPGLTLVAQGTNILGDVTLSWLMDLVGMAAAQRILMAGAVLVFAWGAFALARVLSGRAPWPLLPCLMVLAYGWVFHAGLVNFYLSMGLCLWALAALWGPRPAARLAAPLLALAILAHAVPVGWAAAVAAYAWLARRIRRPAVLAGAALAAIVALRVAITASFPTRSSFGQVLFVTGADQALVYGEKYLAIAVCLALLWAALFRELVRQKGLRPVIRGLPFQLAALTAAGLVLVPVAVHLPQYGQTLWFLTDRMSLAVAVLLCAVLAEAELPRVLRVAPAALAGLYFCFLYVDGAAWNRVEDRMEALVSGLPARQRVVNTVGLRQGRLDPLAHMLDRACVGRCYSYGNYEPSTRQFRLRAAGENPFVLADYEDCYRLATGKFTVRPRDLPLYAIRRCGQGLCIGALAAGETVTLAEAP